MRDMMFRTLVLTMAPRALNAWATYRTHPELPGKLLVTGDRFADELKKWLSELTHA